MKKRIVLVVLISAIVLSIIIAVLVWTNIGNDSIESSNESVKNTMLDSNNEPIIGEGDYVGVDNTENVFEIISERTDGNKATVKISIGGDVSISNYKLGLRFDSQALRLISYDSELSIYSPIVNPEIIDGVIKWQRGINDIIEMTWASANNCSKPGDIIIFEFDILDDTIETIPVVLSVEEIGCLNDSNIVEKPNYSIDDSGL